MPTIVALGEMLIDFAPVAADAAGYPTLKAQPGGAPCNFLAALQKYGCSTAMIGKVGDDRFGRLLIQTAADCGIETRGIIKDAAAFTTMAFVTLDADGNREYSIARKPGADTCLTELEVDYSLIDACRVFHFGTLSLTDEPARTATQKAVAYAKAQGKLISFDPNLRKPLWPDESAAAAQMEWGLHQADIVKISDEEVDFLWHTTPATAAQKLLREYGVRLVYVTMGPRGCYFANRNGSGTTACPTGIHVVDTTGAGDIFGGSAMSQMLKLDKAPEALSAEDMSAITRFACCAASLSTRHHGGINSIPEEQEVLGLMRQVQG